VHCSLQTVCRVSRHRPHGAAICSGSHRADAMRTHIPIVVPSRTRRARS